MSGTHNLEDTSNKIENDQKLFDEVNEIVNRINLIAFGNYQNMSDATIATIITNLANEKTNLELKNSQVEKLISQLKVKLQELRFNLNAAFYLSQMDFSFRQFEFVQTRLLDFENNSKKKKFQCKHNSSVYIENENQVSIQLNKFNLTNLFNHFHLLYNQVNEKIETGDLIKKEVVITLQKVQNQLNELSKIVTKKKIKLEQKELFKSTISILTVFDSEPENKIGYYIFIIASWLIPCLFVILFFVLLIIDPFHFELAPDYDSLDHFH